MSRCVFATVLMFFLSARGSEEPSSQTADDLDVTSTLQLPKADDITAAEDPIVGGANSPNDPQVFMLISVYPSGGQSTCSATLVGPKTLLTAAHCLDPRLSGERSMRVFAVNRTSMSEASQVDIIPVTRTVIHPNWAGHIGQNPANDIGMATLQREPGVTPKEMNLGDISSRRGKTVRSVGYGMTGPSGRGVGVRRTVELQANDISNTHIVLGDFRSRGICQGDSGGPSFHKFEDGVERVVGVHSFTVPHPQARHCTLGADIRVDRYTSFIAQFFAQSDADYCVKLGLCTR